MTTSNPTHPPARAPERERSILTELMQRLAAGEVTAREFVRGMGEIGVSPVLAGFLLRSAPRLRQDLAAAVPARGTEG